MLVCSCHYGVPFTASFSFSFLWEFPQSFKKIALTQPSSAAAEKAFSLLQNSFGKRQEHSLEDYIQLPAMMQYNH